MSIPDTPKEYAAETPKNNPPHIRENLCSPSLPQNRLMQYIDGKHCAYALLALWLLSASALMLMPAYVPDEAWFFYEALRSAKAIKENGSWATEFFFHHNSFGYGGVWWTFYTGLVLAWDSVFDILNSPNTGDLLAIGPATARVALWQHATAMIASPMMMMRLLSLGSLAGLGAVLVRTARTGTGAIVAVFILVTMPLAWWSGKMASPELMPAALLAIAATLWFHSGRATLALALATIAVGIKPTIAPIYTVLLSFIFTDVFKKAGSSWKSAIAPLTVCGSALLVCNSWVFYDLRSGIDQYLYLSHAYAPNPDRKLQSDLILWMHPNSWEGTNYGSLAYWTGGFSIIVVSLLSAFWSKKSLGIFLLLGGLLQYLFMMTQPPHGWYWAPFILCTLIPFSKLKSKTAALAFIATVSAIFPFQYTKHEISYRQSHLHELDQVDSQQQCIQKSLLQIQPDIVYDMASVGTMASNRDPDGWRSMNYHDSFVALIIEPHLLPREKKKLLLLGPRSYLNQDALKARAEIPGRIAGECRSIRLVNIEN